MLKCSEKTDNGAGSKRPAMSEIARKPDVWRTTRVVLQPKRVGGVYAV